MRAFDHSSNSVGNVRNHEVVRKAERHAEDDQEAADERGALDSDARDVSGQAERSVDHTFEDQGVKRGEGRCLDQRDEASNEATQDDAWQGADPTLPPKWLDRASRRSNGVRIAPFRQPWEAAQPATTTTSKIPGINPAMNNRSNGTLA